MKFWIIACLLLTGCFGQRGSIRTAAGTVVGVKDAGKAATFDSTLAAESLALPVGSVFTVTKTEAQPAIAATGTTPAVAAKPAQEVAEIKLSAASEWRKNATVTHADTGTVDTSIAKHRIDAEESRWLLWASIGAAAVAIFLVYVKYPTPAVYAGAASVVFFMAWKVSGLPDWFWAIGAVSIVAGVVMWRAHERGLKTGAAEPTTALPVIPDGTKVVAVTPSQATPVVPT